MSAVRKFIDKLNLFRLRSQGTGVMNEKPPHDLTCQSEKRTAIVCDARAGSFKRFDANKLEVELVDEKGWLPAVPGTFALHMAGGKTFEFGVENFKQPVARFPVASAKSSHEGANRFRLV